MSDHRTRAVWRPLAGLTVGTLIFVAALTVPAAAQARAAAPLELKISVPAPAAVIAAGETVTLTFTATNAGTSAVALPDGARLVVDAVQKGPVASYTGACTSTGELSVDSYVKYSGEFALPTTVQPGQTFTCTTTYTATAEDVAAGGIFGVLSYYRTPTDKDAGWKHYTLAAEGGEPTPVISSPAIAGTALTVKRGFFGWWNEVFEYRWLVDGTAAGSGTTFTPTDDHLGAVIRVRVDGMSEHGAITKTSAATAPVVGRFSAPTPRLVGNTRVGSTLSAIPGIWSPVPSRTSYQWYRGSTAIAGATAWTYKLTAADRGKTVKVKVTGARPGYPTLSRVSAPTPVIASGVIVTDTPEVSGTTRVGSRLRVTAGAWRPASVMLTYRWYRDNSAIKGATKSTYVLTAADRGKTMRVKVTGAKTGYTTVARVSKATAEIR